MDTVIASVAKTHRASSSTRAGSTGSISAEIGMQLAEKAFFELDAPLARVCSAEVPIPYARIWNRRRSRRCRASSRRPRKVCNRS
jgi:2-oxoisovalerate dehydrogenase E1 component